MRYSGAPYNFVPITEKVYQRYEEEKKLPKHNEINSRYFSGELICNIQAITDIFIGSGKIRNENGEEKQEFYKGIDGNYAIPGSSLRGLVRNNMQVLGFGSIAGDVEDYNIMYRTVGAAKSKISKYYSNNILDVKIIPLGKSSNGKQMQVTVPKNVKAGYIKKDKENYVIYKTEVEYIKKETFGECNYYPVYEPFVMKENEDAKRQGNPLPFSAFDGDGAERLQHIGKSTENKRYVPYYMRVYYKLKDIRRVVSILPYEGKCPSGYKEGYVISTGKMNEKKTFYVIPKCKESDYIKIPKKDTASFRRDYENKKNKLHGALKDDTLKKDCMQFFELPKEGEMKPIFYVERGGRLYFGYTPFLRIFYEHSVLHGISEKQRAYMDENGKLKKAVLDYPSAILGYATDKSSYKSRVYFEDMKLQKGEKGYPKEKKVTLNQGEPKLSSYWDYLIQDREDAAMTYNDDNFQIRGIKQYWLHHHTMDGGEVRNAHFAKPICPLEKNAVFRGKIHFKNLTKDELGLLLWSLSLEVDSNQNIGRGKAFGYGRIDISIEQLRLYDYHKMYENDCLKLNVFDEETGKQSEQSVNDFIKSYKDFVNQNFPKEKDLMEHNSIDTFLKMKDTKLIPKEEKIRYMALSDYRNRDIPLQTPQEIIDGKKYTTVKEENNRNGNHDKNRDNNRKNKYNSDKKSGKNKEYKDSTEGATMAHLFKDIKL